MASQTSEPFHFRFQSTIFAIVIIIIQISFLYFRKGHIITSKQQSILPNFGIWQNTYIYDQSYLRLNFVPLWRNWEISSGPFIVGFCRPSSYIRTDILQLTIARLQVGYWPAFDLILAGHGYRSVVCQLLACYQPAIIGLLLACCNGRLMDCYRPTIGRIKVGTNRPNSFVPLLWETLTDPEPRRFCFIRHF